VRQISSEWVDRLFAVSSMVLILGAALVLIGTIATIVMSGIREQFSSERISANEAATASAVADSRTSETGSSGG
jgi:hypothetical protein